MKSLIRKAIVVLVVVSFTSCKDNLKPNYQYMPNMYQSVAYETYSESDAFNSPYANAEDRGKEGQVPAKGSIKRGFEPYEYPNTTEGYDAAKLNLKSPLDSTSVDVKKGEELYTIYCSICHGEAGDGKGKLVKQEKFLGVPNYKDRPITEGSIFHVITYGLNSMGSHANQLSPKERWLVTQHVLKLRNQ